MICVICKQEFNSYAVQEACYTCTDHHRDHLCCAIEIAKLKDQVEKMISDNSNSKLT